jgi:dihydroorotate dehydrogenase (NAD+) catalytic subunit
MLFAENADTTFEVVKAVKSVCPKPLIVKLTPNVADIVPIALAAQNAGADAVSLINTVIGMAINPLTRRFELAKGGLSGPAIKPIALYMVNQVYNTADIPIIGMGGVSNAMDAIEFILAGATMVGVGTANFTNPKATTQIIDELENYCASQGILDINELIGQVM